MAYKTVFKEHGVTLKALPFRGKYNGKIYPEDYTEEEKSLIGISGAGAGSSEKMLGFYKEERKENVHRFCRMGQMYAKIHSNGDAYRCCIIQDSGKLGNLLEETFQLLDEPAVCNYNKCECWRAMVVGEEEGWASHWS